MGVEAFSWERSLLSLAAQGKAADYRHAIPVGNEQVLHDAYEYCDSVVRQNSPTFYTASGLLPGEQRRGMRSLYAFCRMADDLVDRASGNPEARLSAWAKEALSNVPSTLDPVALAWADTRTRYRIPARYAEQLVEGVARDFTKKHYDDFDELAAYCYGVASTVGLMAMHIVGFSSDDAIPYAVKLGVAMQVTNILRDVREDWQAGRLYLPQDELAAFGLSAADIEAARNTSRWQQFMKYQVERNRRIYEEAMPGIRHLNPAGRFAIGAAAELYRALLDEIETNDYNVFQARVSLSNFGKLRRLPGAWWRWSKPSGSVFQTIDKYYTS